MLLRDFGSPFPGRLISFSEPIGGAVSLRCRLGCGVAGGGVIIDTCVVKIGFGSVRRWDRDEMKGRENRMWFIGLISLCQEL